VITIHITRHTKTELGIIHLYRRMDILTYWTDNSIVPIFDRLKSWRCIG